LPLSAAFWPAYNLVKEVKPIHTKGLKPKSLEAKAHENLKCALKVLNHNNDSLMEFLKMLIEDVEKYKTLSDRTLGRLARNPLSTKATDAQKKSFADEVLWIRNSLGADYLTRILKRVEHQKEEIVIAVENGINV
jgi:hypothetical protein